MQNIEKWIPLVKKMAEKRSSVNLIYSAEDLEQEVLYTLLRFWHRLEPLDDTSVERMIRTIFKNRVIDIVRSQIRRPDTYWNCKSDVLDVITEKVWAGETSKESTEGWFDESTEEYSLSARSIVRHVEFDLAGNRARAEVLEERETTFLVKILSKHGEPRDLVRGKVKHNCLVVQVYPAGLSSQKPSKPMKVIRTSTMRKEAGAFMSEVRTPGQDMSLEETLREVVSWAEDRAGYGGEDEAAELKVLRRILEEDDPKSTRLLREELGISWNRWDKLLKEAKSALETAG